MDPSFYVIDPEGDLLLYVEECLGQLHVSVFRTTETYTPLSTPRTLLANEGLSDDIANTVMFSSDAPEMQFDPSSLLGLQQDDGVRVFKLRVLISSKHLTLVSKFFRTKLEAMLDLGESDILPSCANEVDALLVLLDVLHCQTRKVPRFLAPDMLFMVAVLADHYRCIEAVEAFSEVWIENLKKEVPTGYTADLTKWIFIAWIFRDQNLFELTTGIAVRESIGPLSDLPTPMIPGSLLRTIEKSRQDSIGYIIQIIYRRLETLVHHGCCDDCDRLIAGTLVRQLQMHQLYPRPTAPFHGYNVDLLVRFINTIPEPRCNVLIHPVNGCLSNCVLLPELDHVFFDTLENNMTGMTATEFPLRVE
ncbi:hypothetical protein P170DRAFT_505962 [Aspergillus steynii IBT 23096]|uniref:BTB domain-containing protein n=1 Tax=Aspergillus steynii IBT 23096 TaxID=1392250 RepID=A0A2I2GR49_9EURO|nr:uncharacterized protein P170DRAFT_505962 [Aspergillus steynii IBT 23096]PLB55360.1 hypothetical protein P170DRAFT_505962 [Aspergillus steynii IBT 23096]